MEGQSPTKARKASPAATSPSPRPLAPRKHHHERPAKLIRHGTADEEDERAIVRHPAQALSEQAQRLIDMPYFKLKVWRADGPSAGPAGLAALFGPSAGHKMDDAIGGLDFSTARTGGHVDLSKPIRRPYTDDLPPSCNLLPPELFEARPKKDHHTPDAWWAYRAEGGGPAGPAAPDGADEKFLDRGVAFNKGFVCALKSELADWNLAKVDTTGHAVMSREVIELLAAALDGALKLRDGLNSVGVFSLVKEGGAARPISDAQAEKLLIFLDK